MKIIIYGAGKTGQYLTRILTIEGHDITVIEPNSSICSKLSSLYDISIIESGDIKRSIFNEEIFSECNLFIAVGPVDEMNIMACSVAKKVGAQFTIARVRNEDYGVMDDVVNLRNLGIDMVIHPEKELSDELLNLILHPQAIEIYELYKGKIVIVSTIIKETSKIVGKSLSEISKIFDLTDLRAVVVEKGIEVIIPTGNYVIEANDKIYAVVQKENIDRVFKIAGYKEELNKDIMINGSGKIAQTIASELEKKGKFKVKIIVNNEEKANQFSEQFTNSLVVFGEATDIDILAAAGIIDMDFFLALTENDETNVVSSLLANHLKVKRTITLIEKTDYFPITKTIGLQRCINSSIATSNAIMRFARHGNVQASSTLKGIDIEVISFKITQNNKLINLPLRQIKFPPNTIIGVIVRNGKLSVPGGNDKMNPGDEIVVFAEKSSVLEVEKLFNL